MLTSKQKKSNRRILLEIPDFDDFANLLHERLHAILYYYEEWNSRFMLLTNLYDRDPLRITERRQETPDDIEALIYCGTKRQRHILEKQKPNYLIQKLETQGQNWNEAVWRAERDKNWIALDNQIMDRNMPNVETFPYFDRFRNEELKFEDVEVDTLKSYFATLGNDFKKNEHPIMSDYFDVENDKYIGIPLLGMGLFQGIVWIVFKAEESSRFEDSSFIRRIIKYFQVEYDNLVLDWDITGDNIKEESKVSDVFDNLEEDNPIQKKMKLKRYYDISEYYHTKRVKQSDEVVKDLKTQYTKTATINTLLDSYAHNISAHSLTTLSWWFRELAEYLDENHGGRRIVETLGRDSNPLIQIYKSQRKKGQEATAFRQSLSRELATMFKFLLEKGAFWSGITRQTNFTGKVSSLFSILWYDFANNPLYLGTIANTEQVRKLHLRISIYKKEEVEPNLSFRNKKYIKQNASGQYLRGRFATINLDDFSLEPNSDKEKESVFVEKGECFDILEKELKQIKAFFPGGVVGKHAFFTLLENEIRNVKHYKGERLKEIQDNGLTLGISIHSRPVDSDTPPDNQEMYELLKVGVWLHHPTEIDTEFLLKRIEHLDQDIITKKTFRPRLGGNQQDKLCAAMLLTKTFDKVQDKDSPLGEIYYPWLKSVSANYREYPDHTQEFEVSHRKYKQTDKESFKNSFELVSGEGYLKKYFHIWRGDEIKSVTEKVNFEKTQLENYTRFRFLNLKRNALFQKRRYKQEGAIRTLENVSNIETLEQAYQSWFPSWLISKDDKTLDTVVDVIEGDKGGFYGNGTYAFRIQYRDGKITFFNKNKIQDIFIEDEYEHLLQKYEAIPNRIIVRVEHGAKLTAAENKLNIRSHGELVRQFGQGKFPSFVEDMSTTSASELLEILATKVCLFDARVLNRLVNINSDKITLQKSRLSLLEESLRLRIYGEEKEQWNAMRQSGFVGQFNFLVVHLSFIEKIQDSKGKKYSEERILEFIDEQVLRGTPKEQVPDNFILAITTGRGRMAWWDIVSEHPEYARFTTFRPIESILGAVEDALQMPDDIDLKYNLTKLLFGS